MTPAGRVVRFIALLTYPARPGANRRFAANDSILLRLAAAHMRLIAHTDKPSKALYNLLGSGLESAQNTIWITNRQQGKTTAIESLWRRSRWWRRLSRRWHVYSTKQDRAAELVRAARDYLYWMQDAGAHPMWPRLSLSATTTAGLRCVWPPACRRTRCLHAPKPRHVPRRRTRLRLWTRLRSPPPISGTRLRTH